MFPFTAYILTFHDLIVKVSQKVMRSITIITYTVLMRLPRAKLTSINRIVSQGCRGFNALHSRLSRGHLTKPYVTQSHTRVLYSVFLYSVSMCNYVASDLGGNFYRIYTDRMFAAGKSMRWKSSMEQNAATLRRDVQRSENRPHIKETIARGHRLLCVNDQIISPVTGSGLPA